jgi:hypothetical protein
MNEIVTAPRFERPCEPPSNLRQIALTRERPPGETAAKAGQNSTRERAPSEGLNGQCAAADANEPAGQRQAFACSVPSAPIPDTCGGAVRRQVEVFVA